MKKTISFFAAFILTVTAVCPVSAGNASVKIPGSPEASVFSAALLETASELDRMTPGENYDEKSAFILVDSLEEAEKAAAQYDAVLTGYNYGVATLSLKKNIRTVLRETADSAEICEDGEKRIMLYPQTKMRLYGSASRMGTKPDTNDPKLSDQWFHEKLDTGTAWQTAKGAGALAVIIDSGARGSHNDLSNNISGNEAILTGSSSNNGNNGGNGDYGGGWGGGYGGYSGTKDWDGDDGGRGGGDGDRGGRGDNGWGGGEDDDWGGSGSGTNNDMSDGHGTHVAGLVAADENNSCCGAGIAPDAGLYIIKVVTEGSGRDEYGEQEELCEISDIISGINRAAELKAHVINLSLGADESEMTSAEITAMQDAVNKAHDAGVTVVAAAGNEGSSGKSYPSALDHVINVGAMKKGDTLCDFSNYGEYVDLCAPGEGIYSTVTSSDDAFESMDGTSMASPIVAGVAALVYSANSDLLNGHDAATADKVSNILLSATDETDYKYESHLVHGCIDAAKAVKKSSEGDFSGPADTTSGNNLVFKEKGTGYLTSYGKNAVYPIARGKSIKLQVCDSSGNPVAEAKKNKNVTWSLSNTSDFTIRNGKLKAKKNASIGADTYVYAEFGDKKVSARFAVSRPVVALGYYDENSGKAKSKITVNVSSGSGGISVGNPDTLINNEVYVFYKKPSQVIAANTNYGGGGQDPYNPGGGSGGGGSDLPDPYWPGDGGESWWWTWSLKDGESTSSDYTGIASVGYTVRAGKPGNMSNVVRDKNGNITSFTPVKSGKYTVTYTLIDGSNKKFKVKLKV